MVLAQMEAAALAGREYPRHVMLWTVAGTLSIYGMDRLTERRNLTFTAMRHRVQHRSGILVAALIATCAVAALTQTGPRELLWLAALGFSGVAYLALTVNALRGWPLLKEVLGAWCFTCLVWGMLADRIDSAVMGVFLLGLSNFCWSSRQDRVRDQKNGIASFAVRAPGANLVLARLGALLAAVLFQFSSGWIQPFFWTALLHAAWPAREDYPIDLAFLPLVANLIRLFPG